MTTISSSIQEKIWTKEELLKAATEDNLTPKALQAFVQEMLARLQIEVLAHGNFVPQQAEQLLDIIEDRLGKTTSALPPHTFVRGRQAALTTTPRCLTCYLFQHG